MYCVIRCGACGMRTHLHYTITLGNVALRHMMSHYIAYIRCIMCLMCIHTCMRACMHTDRQTRMRSCTRVKRFLVQKQRSYVRRDVANPGLSNIMLIALGLLRVCGPCLILGWKLQTQKTIRWTLMLSPCPSRSAKASLSPSLARDELGASLSSNSNSST